MIRRAAGKLWVWVREQRTNEKEEAMESENGPLYQLTLGGVQGAVFARKNQTNGRTFYSAAVNSFYQNGNGDWKPSSNYDAGELGNLLAVAAACQAFIIAKLVRVKG